MIDRLTQHLQVLYVCILTIFCYVITMKQMLLLSSFIGGMYRPSYQRNLTDAKFVYSKNFLNDLLLLCFLKTLICK